MALMADAPDPVASTTSGDGVTLHVNLRTGDAREIDPISLASVGLKERADLQRWITEHPRLVGDGLLLVTSEFDRWEAKVSKVADRLDVLFLDTSGSPVVAELKRDRATDTVELQALKYAAYCSQLTVDDLVEVYATFHGVDVEHARGALIDHAPSLAEAEPGPVRIRLVAGGFGPLVTSVVLWLREYGIDVGCVEVTARAIGDGSAVVSAQQLIPLPEAEDFQVRRRRKEQTGEQRRERSEWTWEMYADRYPAESVAVARELFARLERYVAEHQLPWTERFRSSWLGFTRSGGYFVPVIDLFTSRRPTEFSIKVPDDPERLRLTSPYNLKNGWNEGNRQWRWEVPDLASVPDVAPALEISRRYQPLSGPMPGAEEIGSGPVGES